jgi:hypothetical protein
MTVVKLVGGSIRIPGLAENENVIAKSEGVREDSNRAEVDIGVVTGGLAGGRTVKVPFRELIDRFNRLGESLGLAAAVTDSVDPDVLSLDMSSLVEAHVLHEILRVGDDG